MTTVYLWINAIAYAVLAAWCTLMPLQTAKAIGFLELSAGGRAEYAAIYGGLQAGLAFLFGWTALAGQHRFGLMLALALYTPIVVFRGIAIARHGPVGTTTLALAATEVVLLIAAALLWRRLSPIA